MFFVEYGFPSPSAHTVTPGRQYILLPDNTCLHRRRDAANCDIISQDSCEALLTQHESLWLYTVRVKVALLHVVCHGRSRDYF